MFRRLIVKTVRAQACRGFASASRFYMAMQPRLLLVRAKMAALKQF
jgi:hypothetical protein